MRTSRTRSTKAGENFARATVAAKYILSKTRLRPKVALVLGTGLGAVADQLTSATRIRYEKIPGFPRSTTTGHAGCMVTGKLGGVAAAAMQGRAHLYEGYSAEEAGFPMRVFWKLGIRAAILTNAAGAIQLNFAPGALVAIRDHINLQCANPLRGANDERFGPRFPDMTDAYCEQYRTIASMNAKRLGISLHEGVYAAVPGPSYETPAEIRYLRTIGADLVGMSTVPEVIVARHMGIRVLAISCVTNVAAGIEGGPLDHSEVMKVSEQAQTQMASLLAAIVPAIAETTMRGSS